MILSFIQEDEKIIAVELPAVENIQVKQEKPIFDEPIAAKSTMVKPQVVDEPPAVGPAPVDLATVDSAAKNKLDNISNYSFESKYLHFKEKIEKDRLAWETFAKRK